MKTFCTTESTRTDSKNGKNILHSLVKGVVLAAASVALSACSAEDAPQLSSIMDVKDAEKVDDSTFQLSDEQLEAVNDYARQLVLGKIDNMDSRKGSMDSGYASMGGYGVIYENSDSHDAKTVYTQKFTPELTDDGSLKLTVDNELSVYDGKGFYEMDLTLMFTNQELTGLLDDGELTKEEVKEYLQNEGTSLVAAVKHNSHESDNSKYAYTAASDIKAGEVKITGDGSATGKDPRDMFLDTLGAK